MNVAKGQVAKEEKMLVVYFSRESDIQRGRKKVPLQLPQKVLHVAVDDVPASSVAAVTVVLMLDPNRI